MSTPGPQPRIEIVVDELVLRGVQPGDAHAVAAALQQRLGSLAGDWAAGAAAAPRAREEAFRRVRAAQAPAATPAALGFAVADAVWQGVTAGGR